MLKKRQLLSKLASCHDKPLYAHNLCRSCYEKELRARNPDYAARQRTNCREWCKLHAEQKKRTDAAYRKKLDPALRWARSIARYGITPIQYEQQLKRQKGCCAICGKKPTKQRLAIDHNHETGVIRGLLCFRCNFGLSWFQEDAELLAKASKHVTTQLVFKD